MGSVGLLAETKSRPLTIGFASGTLGSVCGIGGAVFAIPALVRFSALPQRVAAGNSLVAVTAVAIAGAASFHSASAVDFNTAAALGLSASVFTPLGARAAYLLNASYLRKALGLFTLVLAPVLPLRDAMSKNHNPQPTTPVDCSESSGSANTTKKVVALSGAGAAVGVVSGLLGISGGSVFTPLIAATCPEMPFHTVMGTSFAAMILPTSVGAVTYAKMGMIAPASLPSLVIGAAIGARVGSYLALSVPDEVLHYIFAGVFAVMGVRTLRAPMTKSPSPSPGTSTGKRVSSTQSGGAGTGCA